MNRTLLLLLLIGTAQDSYTLRKNHPRLFIDDAKQLPRDADAYKIVKERADAAVKRGSVEYINNGWAIPEDLMNCSLAWLVEKDRRYADLVIKQWGDGAILSNPKSANFGYHAIAFDWIHDALTPAQRKLYGDALGSWLRYFTDKPEITLKFGHWEYNQTWGPIHLNVMNARDAITPKLLVALAISGAGTKYEDDAKTFLDSWHKRIPAECIPAFDRMGGVWSESFGHGGYGPVTVIPYAFHAWRTATGIDLFKKLKPSGFPVEEPRWVAYTMMPHNERTAWIDDGDGSKPAAFARAAPMMRDGLSRWFSDRQKDWGLREHWQRAACLDPSVKPVAPSTLPLAYCFAGAGHVYMRSAWNDPDATWAFFGAGPQFAGHARDDEGHFLIGKRGALVSRQGGQGHNDDDFHAGGSLIFNIVTIYDPAEKMRRDKGNENDGGLRRRVYEGGPFPAERGHLVAFENAKEFTYAAADLTKAYSAAKTKEVTRQFLYLRGEREFFVLFDRVEASKPDFKRHWFLHVPTEPKELSWFSLPEADGDRQLLSKGRSALHLHSLLPAKADVVVRGGPGREAWGHPLNPDAQYNHDSEGRKKPPVCPWRIEIGDPTASTRTLFLNVFELTDEGAKRATDVKFIAPAGVDIGSTWKIRFNADGAIGGTVNGAKMATTLQIESQYK